MSVSKRMFVGGAAILAALLMIFGLAGFASAGTAGDTACVQGYVINHREQAVDGTQFTPQLQVEAVSNTGAVVLANVNAAGFFSFANLPVGNWNFRLQLPTDWDALVPITISGGVAETGMTKLEKRTNCYPIVFKVRRLFNLTVIKWEELLDGTVRRGVGWQITATSGPPADPYAISPQTQTTDQNGQAFFVLTPGTWTITESFVGKPGWAVATGTSNPVKITLYQYDPPGAMPPVIFKNRQPACHAKIVVQKLGYGTDASGNEIPLGPLAGWAITVTPAGGPALPVQYTDGFGETVFTVHSGVYSVAETVRPGWEKMDTNPQTVILRDCEEYPITFRNKEVKGKLRIFGYKYFFAQAGPFIGSTQIGLSSWVITATLVGANTAITTTTNALGYYEFTEAALESAGMAFPGATINVAEELRFHWIPMGLTSVNIQFPPYPIPATYNGVQVNFKNKQDPPEGTPYGASLTTTAAAGCSASYTVQRGDTLARIAASQGTSVSAITRASGIANANLIRTGQALCIR